MRLFVAVEIPAAIRQRLAALIDELRRELPTLRWAREEAIHLTLRFLGEVASEDVGRLEEELQRRVSVGASTFPLQVRGLGAFPGGARARVLWVGLEDPAGELLALQGRVEAAVLAASLPGVTSETRPFRPHLTLARLGEVRPPAQLAALLEKHREETCGEMVVSSCALFQSHLGPGGARHVRLAEFAL